jgi:phosphocarrier protein
MIEKQLEVVNKNGLHTRPAANVVKLTSKFKADVYLVKDGMKVNGKSIIGVMTLAAEFGSFIKVIIDGVDEEDAMNKIEELFSNGFGEL